MRRLLALLLLWPIPGCFRFQDYPERDFVVELTDSGNKPIPEWWVFSWQETHRCHFGLVLAGPSGVAMDPRTSSVENVRLVHMTRENNRMLWTGSYDYLVWYLVLFPPGGAWQGWTWFRIVAPDQPGEWEFQRGDGYPWEICRGSDGTSRIQAKNNGEFRDPSANNLSSGLAALRDVAAHLEDLRNSDPRCVPRADPRDFLTVVLWNSNLVPHASRRWVEDEQKRVRAFLDELNDEAE